MKNKVFISSLGLLCSILAAGVRADAPSATAPELAADAPEVYTVQPGDTLWALASRYLKDPWAWPELWYSNPGIQNPHLIYPGETLRLVRDAQGRPHLEAVTGTARSGDVEHLSPSIRTSPLAQPVPTIPREIIAAFMRKPAFVSIEQEKTLPYIVAFDKSRVVGGMGDAAYVRDLTTAPAGTLYDVVHVGEKIKDPESGRLLGYSGINTGEARLERAGGGESPLARLLLVSSTHETLSGDRVVPASTVAAQDFVPHAPRTAVEGRIVASLDEVLVIGQYHVVLLNKGSKDGLEPGHVLTIYRHGQRADDRGRGGLTQSSEIGGMFVRSVALPSERSGTLLVFRTERDVSFGLVLSAEYDMRIGDVVRSP
jgi:LysM domain